MSRYTSPAAASLLAALVWVILAWRTPSSTHHFAPLVAAAAFGVVFRSQDPSPGGARSGVVLFLGGLVAPLIALAILIAADKLQGPTLFESIALRPELVLSAAIGATVGSRPWSWLAPTAEA